MGWGIGNIGGGSSLNFAVKQYLSKADLSRDTPGENTIGIITETPISSWMFSAAKPEAAAEGMVWIETGASSPVALNALKKNGIQVYPLRAAQFAGGAWAAVTAMIYQGGSWSNFAFYLFNHGDISEVTGGWQGQNGSSAWATSGTLTQDGTTLKLSMPGLSAGAGGLIFAGPKKTTDITGFTRVCVHVTAISNPRGCEIAVLPSGTVWNYNAPVAYQSIDKTGWHTLDISTISGEHYVSVSIRQSNDGLDYAVPACSMTVDEVYLI